MAKSFIHHLHIIHAKLNYTYIHIYNLKAYLQLKSIKSIKILISNKITLNKKLGFSANKLK